MLLFKLLSLLDVNLSAGQHDQTIRLLLLLSLIGWTYPLLRRAYGSSAMPAVAQAVGLSLGFLFTLKYVYRLFLFSITYWAL